jgi:SAM-dependent methyltransferase
MQINDKNNLLVRLDTFETTVLELGCGSNKRHANAVGIDALDYQCVDIVGDIYEVLAQFPSGSVDKVYSYHFIEHVESVNRLLVELSRVVKVGGEVEFVAPHFSNPYFYSDPTHRSFFGLYTFSYFSINSPLQRKVPTYQERLWFKLDHVDLVFKSSPPFYIRHAFKKLIGLIFNSCSYMRELYEENLCYLFPCSEVRYKLRRVDAKNS